jgi:hypothetical protein
MDIYKKEMERVVRKQKLDQMKHDAWVAQVNAVYANDPVNIVKASIWETGKKIKKIFKK